MVLCLMAFILAATAYMWLPLVLNQHNPLENRIIKLEREAHQPQDLSPLIKRIADLEQKQGSGNSGGQISPEVEEIYVLLNLERKFESGQPFDGELILLEQLSNFSFSKTMHEMATIGIPHLGFLSQGFVRLALREVEQKQSQPSKESRPWGAMVESWVEKLITIEPLNHMPKAYEPVLNALKQRDLSKAVDALSNMPHDPFNIWLTHAKGRLEATKELEEYRRKRFTKLIPAPAPAQNPAPQSMEP